MESYWRPKISRNPYCTKNKVYSKLNLLLITSEWFIAVRFRFTCPGFSLEYRYLSNCSLRYGTRLQTFGEKSQKDGTGVLQNVRRTYSYSSTCAKGCFSYAGIYSVWVRIWFLYFHPKNHPKSYKWCHPWWVSRFRVFMLFLSHHSKIGLAKVNFLLIWLIIDPPICHTFTVPSKFIPSKVCELALT